MARFRTEKDSLGDVRVPANALYGAQTQRAIDNFPVSGRRLPGAFIAALARVKSACAEAQAGALSRKVAAAIRAACARIESGELDDHFPIDVFQTGSGTSSNMNANEVIANLANESLGGRRGVYRPVHPNDDVNRGQSSNDVIPTAAHVAALSAIRRDLLPALERLASALAKKAREFSDVVKLGRTHLMDAVPVTMGQEFGGYARQVRKGAEQILRASRGLEELALGGTAVGTGLNAPPGFARRACAILSKTLKLPFREARDHFEAQAGRDDLVMVSGALKGLAVSLSKIAEDIRLMGSGPHGGLAELRIPDLQPGSSIMPGKVNPVMCEMLLQVAAQVIGNDAAVTVGGLGGRFELNAMIPVMTANVLDSISLLANGCRLFAGKLVDGLQANRERCREMLEKSPIAATALNPILGYDRSAALVKEALATGESVRTLAVERGLLTRKQADRIFDFRRMTR